MTYIFFKEFGTNQSLLLNLQLCGLSPCLRCSTDHCLTVMPICRFPKAGSLHCCRSARTVCTEFLNNMSVDGAQKHVEFAGSCKDHMLQMTSSSKSLHHPFLLTVCPKTLGELEIWGSGILITLD